MTRTLTAALVLLIPALAVAQDREPFCLPIFQEVTPLAVRLFADPAESPEPLKLTLLAGPSEAVSHTASKATDDRPILIAYKPTFPCTACKKLEQAEHELPFRLKWEVDTKGEMSAYPAVLAIVDGRRKVYLGANIPGLVRWFQDLHAPIKSAQAADMPKMICINCRRGRR